MDRQLQDYLRTAASAGRELERVGPFLATFDPHTDHPYLSYAIPDDGARPSPGDVAALADAYRRRARVPRLEYLPTVAPEAEAALVAGGFEVEARLPLMTCAAGEAADVPAPEGIAIEPPVSDADLVEMHAAQMAAFGEPPAQPDPDATKRTRERLAAGAIAILARDRETGGIVGGGWATTPSDGVTEVAGIGVLEPFRRRGIAGAITARLARDAFAGGVDTALITPGDDGAQSVYARAGFRDSTTMLHLRATQRV